MGEWCGRLNPLTSGIDRASLKRKICYPGSFGMSDKRDSLPAELRRRVLVEAGHRCAIPTCAQPTVDIHHIVPWAECQNHEYGNLIALCPNCHRRAENGAIDRKSLYLYKERLTRLWEGIVAVEDCNMAWSTQVLSESVEGPPGYEVRITYPVFSTKKVSSADEINSLIKSTVLDEVYSIRRRLLDAPQDFNDPYGRLPVLEADFEVTNVDDQLISLAFNFRQCHPSAVHPRHWTSPVNLRTTPLIPIGLRDVLPLLDKKADLFVDRLRDRLLGGGRTDVDYESLEKRTGSSRVEWKFTISNAGIRFIFDEYEIACYAAGRIECELSFDELRDFMTENSILWKKCQATPSVGKSFEKSSSSNLWPPGKWTVEHDEALDFHTGTQRSQAVVLAVSQGPKTMEEINAESPPHDLDGTRLIVDDVSQKGWIQPTSSQLQRYELSSRGYEMLRALETIPKSVKDAAWKRNWLPQKKGSN